MKIPKAVKRGSSWRVQVVIDGKRRSVTGATKKEAESKAAAMKAGYLEAKKTGLPTLHDAIDGYIKAKEGVLSPSTVYGYRKIQRTRFQGLMGRKINLLTKQVLQSAVSEEAGKVSPKSVKNAFGLVSTVLSFYAVDVPAVDLPKAQRKDKRYLQEDEIPRLLEAVKGDKYELPILLALWLGLRRSEIFGLCWDCVDLDAGTITIRRAYVYDGEWILKESTKTAGSHRVIKLPEYIREKFQEKGPGDGQVFAGVEPGRPRKRLQEICAQEGITMTSLHGLRHTFAAVMLSHGISDRVVMREGGWTSARTMREIYDYVMDAEATRAHQARDGFFSGPKMHQELHQDKEKCSNRNTFGKIV